MLDGLPGALLAHTEVKSQEHVQKFSIVLVCFHISRMFHCSSHRSDQSRNIWAILYKIESIEGWSYRSDSSDQKMILLRITGDLIKKLGVEKKQRRKGRKSLFVAINTYDCFHYYHRRHHWRPHCDHHHYSQVNFMRRNESQGRWWKWELLSITTTTLNNKQQPQARPSPIFLLLIIIMAIMSGRGGMAIPEAFLCCHHQRQNYTYDLLHWCYCKS